MKGITPSPMPVTAHFLLSAVMNINHPKELEVTKVQASNDMGVRCLADSATVGRARPRPSREKAQIRFIRKPAVPQNLASLPTAVHCAEHLVR